MKVLVIGSGAREHCLAWKLSGSPRVDKIYCAPGNPGTAGIAVNLDIQPREIDKLLEFALKEKIDLTVVGPEAPLVEGIADLFENKGLKIFGPSKELAMLEGSKVHAKLLMRKFGLPTADFEVFQDPQSAKEYINKKGAPLVIKADGLAAGKGVVVAASVKEALDAVSLMMEERAFGKAADKIIVEDFLDGDEASILILTDGDEVIPLVSSQDHKRIFDGDQGPNTGGMGAYSPTPLVSDELMKKIVNNIAKPLIYGLRDEGKRYKGILYIGLMIKDGRPYVLEFNVRFGDPETQAVLPKLKSDLCDIMMRAAQNKLKGTVLSWDDNFCLSVVLASAGYPGSYENGKGIRGLDKLKGLKDVWVFHAGTKITGSKETVTAGGRVLSVTSLGATVEEARQKAYAAIKGISFDGMQYRKDIGLKALKYET